MIFHLSLILRNPFIDQGPVMVKDAGKIFHLSFIFHPFSILVSVSLSNNLLLFPSSINR